MGARGLSPAARGGKEAPHKSAGRRTRSQNKAMRRRGLVDAYRLLPSTMLLPFVLLVASSPTLLAGAASESSDMAMNYLEKFGYIAPTKNGTAALRSQEALVDAVKEFQRFAGLRVTGRVDNETASTMQLPRCGVRDKVGFGLDARRRRRRYALQGSKWASNELSYRISKYPRRVKDRVAVDKEIARAFKMWSDVSPLTFTHKKTGPVNIDIQFVRGEHGDGDPFNGPGGTLAHAFFPRYGGDAHFDDEEKWTIDEYTGVNLFQVAAHEFGHSLGLSHSDVRRSLMAPFYRGFEPGFQLDRDDIDGIQSLYGAVHRTTKTPSKGSRKPAQPGPDLCQDAAIDAATRTEDGSSYVFKGDYYWKIETDGVADGYPRRISDDWGGLPGHIDAALTWSDGKTFFFKGGNYWRFRNKQVSKGYPQKISVGFQGIPDNLDAALVWSGNGKTYFFKGNQYWRYDSRNEVPVSDRYPQPVSNWNGLPGHLDAAFQWQNGYSYFFKGPNYYRFNDKDFGVDKGDPPYPRATSVWWFDCKAMSSAMAQQQASSRRHPESATAHVLDRTEAPMAARVPVRPLGLQRDAAPEAPELGPVGHAEPPPPTTVAAGASTLASGTAALALLAVPFLRPLV
ncbi:stromelysin-1-like isoform X1 [Dermacentor variabilis]|uniref:stromelysin-1-like isoform X1 n=1 Tax=Dermacentor variabilis TaxID=34621 RepID=UPI003F5B15AB